MKENENKMNNNIQMGVIIALLVVIAVMVWYFLCSNSWDKTTNTTVNTGTNVVETWENLGNYDDLSITVYEDKRCTNCPTDDVLNQLKGLPSLSWVEIVRKDFSEEGVSDYLEENEITALPLVEFSTNNFDVTKDPAQAGQNGLPAPKINTFLVELASGWYKLEVGSSFNPFEKRSERGFVLLDIEKLEAIKNNSFIKWDADAKVTWIEYSDLECPFCAKLHNAGTVEELEEKYGTDLNIIFNHFPLNFHANAQVWAEIVECLWEQKGTEAFYALIKKSYADEKSTKSFLIDEAVALWANEDALNKCLDDGTYTEKVKSQMEVWGKLFSVTGTPGNVLINNETGEYEVISWAYPTASFITIIDNLLK